MKPQDVLLQLMDENDYYIHDILENAPADSLHFRPTPTANSIAVLIWHVARAQDVFYAQHVRGGTFSNEEWYSGGWADKTQYDPQGLGVYGWGMLNGFTAADVDAIPQMSAETLRGYYDAVSGSIRAYLNETVMETMEAQAPGFEGKQTNWFWIRHPIFDMTRHVGEMLALQGQWQELNS